jgi:hypothetical protein
MADQKISELTDAGTLVDANDLVIEQSSNSRKLGLDTLKTFVNGDPWTAGVSHPDGYDNWVRPGQWPALPTTAANQIDAVAAIFPDGEGPQTVGVRCTTSTGTWSVDWGDGTSTSAISSNSETTHQYTYADVDLTSTDYGYKCALIQVTPDTGNLTEVDFGDVTITDNETTSATYFTINPLIDIAVNGSSITNFRTYNTNDSCCQLLQRIVFHNTGVMTGSGQSNMLHQCINLMVVDLSGADFGTSASNMFDDCPSLREVVYPDGLTDLDTGQLSFGNCFQLRHVNFGNNQFGGTGNFSIDTPSTTTGGFLEEVTFGSSTVFQQNNSSSIVISSRRLRKINNPAQMVGTGYTGTISINLNNLSATELDAIYTALPSLTGSASINVTSNPGTGSDDPTIATAKGWTVIG